MRFIVSSYSSSSVLPLTSRLPHVHMGLQEMLVGPPRHAGFSLLCPAHFSKFRINKLPATSHSNIDHMEEDRAETNLGESANFEELLPKEEKPKQPKKRFVGRKTADNAGKTNGDAAGTIEISGAIQGTGSSSPTNMHTELKSVQ